MLKNKILYRNTVLVSLIILLFMLSYLRYSYFINPNFSGEPLLIRSAGTYSYVYGPLETDEANKDAVGEGIRGKSIVVFWVLYGILNILLIRSWRNRKEDLALLYLTYIGATFIAVCFLGLHYILEPEQILFGMFSRIKNFLLSPLYTGVLFIFAKFFNRIV